jgi:N-formylmaleamate deformylase
MYKKLMGLMTALLLLSLPRLAKAQSSTPYSFSVQKTGQGPAMILIPGLYCSGDVWGETVAHYKDRYTCYSLTLPGFAGRPPIHSDTLLATVAREITRFIRENNLQRPLLVGHSLGGWLVLEVAVQQPQLVGGIVCVSSGPFLPGLSMGNQVSLDSARAIGIMIRNYMAGQTPEQIRQTQQYTLGTMIRDSTRIREVTAMAMRSDPATQGEIMYELFSTDLRPEMHKLRCPVLVLGDYIGYKAYGATRENVLEKYQQQFADAAHVTIGISDSSRHFIMYDEPGWFYGELDKFLALGTTR